MYLHIRETRYVAFETPQEAKAEWEQDSLIGEVEYEAVHACKNFDCGEEEEHE